MSSLIKILAILSHLISINSTTINNPQDYQNIKQILEQNNFKTEIFENQSVQNLYSEFKGNKEKNEIDIAFIGHLDVVEPGNSQLWSNNPFTLTEKNNILYGRGAVDMKSSIAAFLQASIDFIQTNDKINIAIILTGDEETKSLGAQGLLSYVQKNNIKINNILIGEPTSEKKLGDVIKNGRRGSANFDLTIHGIQGHIAYPEKSENPIISANKVIESLLNIELDSGTNDFQPSKLAISSIETNNQTRNITPESVKIKFNVRYNTEQNIDKLKEKISQVIEKNVNQSKYKLSVFSNTESFLSPKSKLSESLVQAIKTITNIDTNYTTGGGTSDGRFLHKIAPIVEFGPLNETAHKIDENISKEDLNNLYKIYFEMLRTFYK
jgi:succinyl-diaminopimelate desuccinylase